MDKIINLEIISISTDAFGVMQAMLSYQDLNHLDNMNNGYSTALVPVNIRPIQYSVRGNQLVDQSVKSSVPVANV